MIRYHSQGMFHRIFNSLFCGWDIMQRKVSQTDEFFMEVLVLEEG